MSEELAITGERGGQVSAGSRERRAQRELAASGLAGRSVGVGAAPNIMAPTNAIPGGLQGEGVQVLAFGIDSIWLSVSGELPDDTLVLLDWAKEQAQESATREVVSPLPPFLGGNLMMQPTGVKGYDYLVRSDDLTVTLRRPVGLKLPPLVVRLSSECLWRLGGGGWSAIDAAVAWVHEVFRDGCQVQVKSFHQCADLAGWVPQASDLGGIVKRADKLVPWSAEGTVAEEDGVKWVVARGDRLTGLAAGHSTRLRTSVYDKTLEMRKSGKDWFREVWAQRLGGEVVADVWRVEGQYGRELLHRYRIETVDDLRAHQAALWRYFLAWFSWRDRNETDPSHPQRWPLIPAWEALGRELPASGPLPLVKVQRPKLAQLSNATYGYITSVMALTGEDDPEAALRRVCELVRATQGETRMGERLRRKRQRYAGRAMGDTREVGPEWRARMALRAEASRVNVGTPLGLVQRLEQWEVDSWLQWTMGEGSR